MYRTNMPSRLARAQATWKEFWDVACALAAENREQLRERMQGQEPTSRRRKALSRDQPRHHQRLVWEGWFPEQAQGWWEGDR